MTGQQSKTFRSRVPYRTSEMSELMAYVAEVTGEPDVAESLHFSPTALTLVHHVMMHGGTIVTDTGLAMEELNSTLIHRLSLKVCCFIDDPQVVAQAEQQHITRAEIAMDRALEIPGLKLIAVGSAPAALDRLIRRERAGRAGEVIVIAAPTGFASVVQMKERIWESDLPAIVVRGRRGGISVLAAILNGLMTNAVRQKGLKDS